MFPTQIGTCGIAWSPAGIRALLLPESSAARTRVRLAERLADGLAERLGSAAREDTPPDDVLAAVVAIQCLLAGRASDLGFINLDMSGVPHFNARVYAVTRQIPPGQTRTYGSVARELGDVRLARAVGTALGRNPFPIVVPCHRVVGADGSMTGFSAPGGVQTKRRMLEIEGVRQPTTGSLFSDSAFVSGSGPLRPGTSDADANAAPTK